MGKLLLTLVATGLCFGTPTRATADPPPRRRVHVGRTTSGTHAQHGPRDVLIQQYRLQQEARHLAAAVRELERRFVSPRPATRTTPKNEAVIDQIARAHGVDAKELNDHVGRVDRNEAWRRAVGRRSFRSGRAH